VKETEGKVQESNVLYVEERRASQGLLLAWCCFHSARVTFISISSSLIGTHEVKAFIAFSKSESRRTSCRASMRAALVACRMSRPRSEAGAAPLPCDGPAEEVGVEGSGEHSPRSMKTSQTRSCAGNGIERLNRVRYQRVP
jgi:hypothetical protein